MKLIKHLLTRILGNKQEFNFEEKFILSCILYTGSLCFLSIFGNLILNLGFKTTLLVSVSFVVYSFNFIVGRFYKKMELAKWLLSIYSFIFCNIYWLVNYGSRGSALYMFLVYFTTMIFIWNRFQIRVISVLFLINMLVLAAIELSDPGFIRPFPTEIARVFDSYLGLYIFMGMLSILILSAKNNYIEQYKQAQKSDKLKSAFLANLSHEIRTPLNAIIGFSQLLTKREWTKEKKEQYSKLITDNGKYLLNLISDIMDISLIESDQMKINFNPVNLNDWFIRIYNTHSQAMTLLNKKEVSLILNIPNEPIIIETDEVRLEQVLSNLLGNAIKFTNKGYIIVGYKPIDNFAQFFVEDTGTGIKEEFQPYVFNRFVKGEDNTDVYFERGTGIGLSLSKDLVQLLGGKIWFTSQFEVGSSFNFALPLNRILMN